MNSLNSSKFNLRSESAKVFTLLNRLVLLLVLFSIQGFALGVTVEGQGLGATKAKALLEAKRDALAKGIGQVLVSKTEVENFMVKRDQIINQTMGHVTSYTVLSEVKSPEGYYETKISAVVAKEGLSKDLASLLMIMKDLGNPRLAFIIEESNMGDIDPDKYRTVETALTEFFKERQFEVVDANQVLRLTQSKDLKAVFEGNPEAAALLGKQVNADVIIVGSAVATEADMSHHSAFKNTSMKSASAQINLKAINVSSHRILTAGSKQAAQIHPNNFAAGDKAFKKAIKNLLKQEGGFYDTLVESWRKAASDGQVITIAVDGIQKFNQIKMVKFFFQNKAEDVTQRSFNKPVLNLDAKYTGSVESLCESLDGAVIEGAGTLSVESYQGHSIQLKLK